MNATTAHTTFDHDRLSVREGIPARDSLDRASCLMAQALSVSSNVADSCDGDEGWALHILLEMAKAYLDAALPCVEYSSDEPAQIMEGGAE